MSLSVGIVGLPNVGKSTLFKALTRSSVDTSNYPFATIDPNVGVVAVPDRRLAKLAKAERSAKIVPTTIEFTDIAGLVRGAHAGEGLGNTFLSHIREVDAIAMVVRAFTDPDVTHVSGKVAPADDAETIELELAFADLATVTKRLEAAERETKSGTTRELDAQIAGLRKLLAALETGAAARTVALTEDERRTTRGLNLLTAKPMLYVLNTDEGAARDASAHVLEARGGTVVPISAKLEVELSELSDDDAVSYLRELGQDERGLDRLIRASYELLDLITFFTAGEKETHAWTVTRGTRAPQAAGRIHSDFERGFIRAEVVPWQDLVAAGSWSAAREAGVLRVEGKDYVVRDGDVAVFRFSHAT